METLILVTMALVCLALTGGLAQGKDGRDRPLVGVIRWDGCWEGSPYVKAWAPKQWHGLLPFYAKETADGGVEVRGDTQEVMDEEIAYASAAGLDYWAFAYYPPASRAARFGYGLKLYLASKRKADINFCLIVFPGHLGAREDWSATAETLVTLFQEPTYQRVLANRPLMYVYMVDTLERFFGSEVEVRQGLDYLRRKAIEVGLGAPYLVAQVWDAKAGANCVDRYGFDAVSAYSYFDLKSENHEHPYQELAQANRAYWEACRATGKKLIPIVNSGWDNRPLQGEAYKNIYPQGAQPWYTEPTPQELADHLASALKWARQHPEAVEADSVLMYAWNETGEGGRLVPGLHEGAARLNAIERVLRPDGRAHRSGRETP